MFKLKSNIVLTVFSILLTGTLFGQQENRTTEIKDYNTDGFADTLEVWSDQGSGFGGKSYSIVNGKSGEVYELDIWGSFGQIRHTLAIPPNLILPKNEAFLNRLKKELLPEVKESTDPSLEWIIQANLNYQKIEGRALFNLVISPSMDWITGTPEIPTRYCVQIEQKAFNTLYYNEAGKQAWYDDASTNGYLIYTGNLHQSAMRLERNPSKADASGFQHIDSTDTYTVLKTGHGIAVTKGDTYKWVFVTDMNLTYGPEKLRWSSIGNIQCVDHYIIFKHQLPPMHYSQFYVIDLETGVCARLNQRGTDFKIEDEKIILTVDEERAYVDGEEVINEVFSSIDLKELLEGVELEIKR